MMDRTLNNGDILAEAYKLAQEMSATLPLPLTARRSTRRGVHGQRKHGSGEDFWQFRDYQPGDASRDVDWRQTAKGERVFIRQRESEMPQTVFFWRDAAEGMAFTSSRRWMAKKDYADILWLAAGAILLKGGERVAVLGSDAAPQLHGSGLPALYNAMQAQRSSLPPEFVSGFKGSHLVIVSDFCRPLDEILPFFERLSASSITATVIQVSDPVEEDFPFKGHVAFHDNRDLADIDLPKAESVRMAYQEAFIHHRRAIENAAHLYGWDFMAVRTDQKLPASLQQLCAYLTGGEGGGHV